MGAHRIAYCREGEFQAVLAGACRPPAMGCTEWSSVHPPAHLHQALCDGGQLQVGLAVQLPVLGVPHHEALQPCRWKASSGRCPHASGALLLLAYSTRPAPVPALPCSWQQQEQQVWYMRLPAAALPPPHTGGHGARLEHVCDDGREVAGSGGTGHRSCPA